MDSFLFKFHACISHKTAKYLQNPRFSRKLHHDSPIEGTKISNLHRQIELDELYRMDSFLLKFHACISHKTAKYLQNPRFSRKLHHDSPIEGTKTSNLYRPIGLDELYRMVMTSSGLHHWIPSERANPRRNAEFFFENYENCSDRAIFSGILYYRGNWWKMCFAYIFRFMLLSFYLSENRDRPTSFNLLFYHIAD